MLLTSNNAAFHVNFLGEFDERLARKLEESLRPDDTSPVHEAKVRCTLAQPVFVGDASAVPDDAGVVNVELLGETVDAQEAEMRYIVDIGHDEQAGDVAKLAAVLGLDAVGVEVIEEGFDD